MSVNHKNARWQRTSLALISFATTTAAYGQSYLQAEHPTLAIPEKAVSPALIPSNSSPKQNTAALPVTSIFDCLDHLSAEGWSTNPVVTEHFSTNNQAKVASDSSPPIGIQDRDLISEFGCDTHAKKTFARGQRQITVDVYSFTSSEGAYGSYCCLRKGASNLISRGDASSEDDQAISLWRDRYFVNVCGTSQDDEESKALITRLANQLASTLTKSGQKPRMLWRLPTIEKVQGSDKLVMGPLGLKKLYPAPYIGALSSDGPILGVIADYQVQEPNRERLKLLVAQYSTPRLASQAFSKYVGQLEEQHDPITLNGLNYQSSVFKLNNTFLLCQLRDGCVLVITGAHKKASVASFANEIY